MLCRIDLTVIALIGIILLIGIVKKNAIMMIDFALEAERQHGKSAAEAIEEACLLRFRPIMMTTMAAMLGGIAIGHRQRNGVGTSPASRYRDCRWLDRKPDADTVHDAGDLSVHGAGQALGRELAEAPLAQARAAAASCGRLATPANLRYFRWPHRSRRERSGSQVGLSPEAK